VETTLAGHGNKFKAYTVAMEALGCGTDFDRQTDPIVRVEAVRLRRALARYYSGAGCSDPLGDRGAARQLCSSIPPQRQLRPAGAACPRRGACGSLESRTGGICRIRHLSPGACQLDQPFSRT